MKKFGICIESSHAKGMGHLFRMLNFIAFLKSKKDRYVVFINDDNISKSILKNAKIKFETVKLNDYASDWEYKLICKHKIDIWVNDRLNTDIRHASFVKKNNVHLVTFDDRGSGALNADINIGGLPVNFDYFLKGKHILKGIKYLLLNKDIEEFRRIRKETKKIIVSLGGSDTYSVTAKVIRILKRMSMKAAIAIGPCFKRLSELNKARGRDYPIVSNISRSLVREFYKYDLAITGSGITPFEANATGLPCITIANELDEIKNALFLERLGSSVFAGYHKNINDEVFSRRLNIEKMSKIGMEKITANAADRIYRQIDLL